jgi:hypothetical protein
MEPDRRGLWLIEEVRSYSFLNVRAHFVPIVPLCENVMGKAFGHVTAVGFLRHAEYDFHVTKVTTRVARLNS